MNANADPAEIAHFEALASQWWDTKGAMSTLHVINPVRVGFICQRLGRLENLRVIDVGCGGGILSESLAEEGAQVLGIDLAAASIAVANAHAADRNLQVEYRVASAEQLAEEQPSRYELVCCLEMLEHVPDPLAVIRACAKLVKPGGDVVFSTINRTPKAYALMILAAEHVLKLLPRGTHTYSQFIRPSELCDWCRSAGMSMSNAVGLRYNPILRTASLNARDLDVNYLLHCKRAS